MTGDRSNLRSPRPTGIPKSGGLKPPVDASVKTKLTFASKNANSDSLSANKTLLETKNQNSLKSQHTSALKSPVKSLIRQYQASPTKQISSKANKLDGDWKTNNALSQRGYGSSYDSCRVRSKETSPIGLQSPTSSNKTMLNANTHAGEKSSTKPNCGIGLGGGSIPHKGFSYISSGSPVHQSKNVDKTSSPTTQIGVKSPTRFAVSLESFKKKTSSKYPDNAAFTSGNIGQENISSQSTSLKSLEKLNPNNHSPLLQSKLENLHMDGVSGPSSKPSNLCGQIEISAKTPKHFSNPQNLESLKRAENRDDMSSEQKNDENTSEPNRRFISRLNRSFKTSKENRPKPVSIPTVPSIASDKSQSELSACKPKTFKSTVNKGDSPLRIPIPSKISKNKDTLASYASTEFDVVKGTGNSPVTPANSSHFTNKENSSESSINQSSFNPFSRNVLSKKQTKINASVKHDSKPTNNSKRFSSPAKDNKQAMTKSKENRPKNTGSLFGLSKSGNKKRSPKSSQKKAVSSASTNKLTEAESSPSPGRGKSSPKSFVSKFTKYTRPSKFSPLSKQRNVKQELMDSNNLSEDSTPLDPFKKRKSDDEAIISQPNVSSTSQTVGLLSVKKPSSLMKSESGSSILTDSSASNVSSSLSQRTKKVSFQSDITICDMNGISTCSNGLRSPDFGHGLDLPKLSDYSLSHESTEDILRSADQLTAPQFLGNVNDLPISWPDGNELRNTPISPYTHHPFGKADYVTDKYRYLHSYECVPDSEEPYQRSTPIFLPLPVATPGVIIPNQSDENLNPQVSPGGFEQYALSCESPIPILICQPNMTTEGDALSSEPLLPESTPNHAILENFTASQVSEDDNESTCISKDNNLSNFTPEISNKADEEEKSFSAMEGPPYYECCETPISNVGLSSMPANVNNETVEQNGDTLPSNHGNNYKQSSEEGKQNEIPKNKSVNHLLKLRNTASELKDQLNGLKNEHRSNIEYISKLIEKKMSEFSRLSSFVDGPQGRPLRTQRALLDVQRQSYDTKATHSEEQLGEVEAAVDELRNEVVERRCLVNAREVESLVLQLSQVGHKVAELKGSFSSIRVELLSVGAAELEVISAEEKFISAEPLRIDTQLKRCRQLASTLLTLKKLASVQEVRSKTPLSMLPLYSSTSEDKLMHAKNPKDPVLQKKRMLDDVRKLKVDNIKRMESIEKAEINWNRRRKFNIEHEQIKTEKALQMADRALNKTNSKQQKESKNPVFPSNPRHFHYSAEATMPENEFTASESSSVDSLSSYSNPHLSSRSPSGFLYPSSYPSNTISRPVNIPYPVDMFSDEYLQFHPEIATVSHPQRTLQPRSSTTSLPRRTQSLKQHPNYDLSLPFPRSHLQIFKNQDAVGYSDINETLQVERSRSVPPHLWNPHPYHDSINASGIPEERRQHKTNQYSNTTASHTLTIQMDPNVQARMDPHQHRDTSLLTDCSDV